MTGSGRHEGERSTTRADRAFKRAANAASVKFNKGMHPHDLIGIVRELPNDLSPEDLAKLEASTLIGAVAAAFKRRAKNYEAIKTACTSALIQELYLPPEKVRKLIRLATEEKPGTGAEFNETFKKALDAREKKLKHLREKTSAR